MKNYHDDLSVSFVGINALDKQQLINTYGGSEFSEWLVRKLSFLCWKEEEVSANISKGNQDGVYWNCGMKSII